jgi:glycosyltransferase involved in cell wall biosynthesis
MSTQPNVTILMPMRNAARFVVGAVTSVLAQEGVTVEILAIDDNSNDGSAGAVTNLNDARVSVLKSPGNGIAGALNAGLAAATGRYIARCDADDWYPEGRLAKQVAWLESHREFAAICGSYTALDEAGGLICRMPCGDAAEEITAELRTGVTRAPLCTYLIDAEAARRVGGFRMFFVTAEDIDFQLRLGLEGRVWYDPESVYDCRLHDASATHTQPSAERLFLEATARRLAGQRAATGSDDLDHGIPFAPPPDIDSPALSADEQIQGLLEGEAWRLHASGRRWAALRMGWSACWRKPNNVASWRGLAALLLKNPRPSTRETAST